MYNYIYNYIYTWISNSGGVMLGFLDSACGGFLLSEVTDGNSIDGAGGPDVLRIPFVGLGSLVSGDLSGS